MGNRERSAEEFLLRAEAWISRPEAMSEEDASELEDMAREMVAKPGLKASDTSAVGAVAQRLRIVALALKYPIEDEGEMYTQRFRNIHAAADNAEMLLRRMEFGGNLRRWRTERGMKIRELASAADVDPGYASRLENFLAGPASIEVATRLARALSIGMIDLWDGYPASLDISTAVEGNMSPEKTAIISEIAETCNEFSEEQLRLLAVALKAAADSERQRRRKRGQSEPPFQCVFA